MKMLVNKLEGFLNLCLVKKAPSIPKRLKEFIVWIAPLLVLVMVVNSLGMIYLLFTAAAAEPGPLRVIGVTYLGQAYYLIVLLSFAMVIMQIFALPGVFERSKVGWNLIFYAFLLNFIVPLTAIVNSSTQSFSGIVILWPAIRSLLFLYLLFQIREFYN